MIFTSWAYLLFLPLVCAAYRFFPVRRLRNLFLLAASLFFYGYMQPRLCLLIGVAALAAWAFALLMERQPVRRGFWLAGGLVALLGLLEFFKYTQFFAGVVQDAGGWIGCSGAALQAVDRAAAGMDAALRWAYATLGLESGGSTLLPPLGISFFTFQCVGYLVDVYRQEERAERNPLDVLLFISFFPQLVAGPIERGNHLLPQLAARGGGLGLEDLRAGLPLILRGLLKKMVLADNLAPLVDKVFLLDAPAAPLLYVGTLAFAFQIYGDFSGYTDIARGSGRLFGIDLLENFRAPYAALNPADFWRRWHISFSFWIRDYLYRPLGGSRKGGLLRLLAVLLVAFGLSGLWHGAAWHFILWGAYFGVLVWGCHALGIHREGWRPSARTKAGQWLKTGGCWLVTFHLILFGWLLFRASSLDWLQDALRKLWAGGIDEGRAALLLAGSTAFYALPVAGWLLVERTRSDWLRGIWYGVLLCWLILFSKGTEYDFIYFRF